MSERETTPRANEATADLEAGIASLEQWLTGCPGVEITANRGGLDMLRTIMGVLAYAKKLEARIAALEGSHAD